MKQARTTQEVRSGSTVEVHQGEFAIAIASEGYQYIRTTHTTTCTIVTIINRERDVAMLLHIDTIFCAKTIPAAFDTFIKALNGHEKCVIECEVSGGLRYQWLKWVFPSYWVRRIVLKELRVRFGRIHVGGIKESYSQGWCGSGFDFDMKRNRLVACTGDALLRGRSRWDRWRIALPAIFPTTFVSPMIIYEFFSWGLVSLALLTALYLVNIGRPWSRLEQVETKRVTD